MELMTCPECDRDVSSDATVCPHCDYPIHDQASSVQASPISMQTAIAPAPLQRYLSFGLSGTVIGFLWACAVTYALAAIMTFFYSAAWTDWSEGGNTSINDLINAEDAFLGTLSLAFFALMVTGILFIGWFFQAAGAAQSRGADGRTWRAGWTIGSWFIPFANLVIPKLVMNEVDRMSNPDTGPPPIGQGWKTMRRSVISDWWWATWLGGLALYVVGVGIEGGGDPLEGTGAFGIGLLIESVGLALYAVAAGLGTGVVGRIGKRLRLPR